MKTLHADTVFSILNTWVVGDPMQLVPDYKNSHGHYLHDTRTGSDFLDFFSFFAARPLSFNHPKMRDKDFLERLTESALIKPSNCDMYSEDYARFVEMFVRVPLGNRFKHVFFVEGGAPACENAVKVAMDWKHRKNIAAGRGERGGQIIHFKQAFHGRTGYAMSMTDSHDIRKTQYFTKFPWPRITNPKMTFPFDAEAEAAVVALEKQAVSEIEQALAQNPHDIAAIMIEPIQGEGGDNYFRKEFLHTLRRLCDTHDLLLIFDEVQTGFGGTGAWWDYLHHGVQPDVLVFGKKTQVCGLAATTRLDEVDSVFKVKSRISSTFAGGLVDMVRCHRVMEIVTEDALIENARAMGDYMKTMLYDMSATVTSMKAVRGRGLWAAFDLPTQEVRNAFVDACFAEKLLVLSCGVQTVRLRPALDMDADAIGRAGAQMLAAFRRVKLI